ncbi:MAG: ubiquinone/menaquinone biosynthesis methyltransferase [Paludibacter sp.]|jgi:demethylmenaquinone methyltransferase/2-methoxy-6-polyprenyl-1,4-benzoquinol methylase|nr:ubiquinone/menaquinone biosynthesis methyltransferase [Paludibacter sp.]
MKSESENFEEVKPYSADTDTKTGQLEKMFGKISARYDMFNRLMSFGNVGRWRRNALRTLSPYDPKYILDIATGTGDFSIDAFRVLKPFSVTAIDISGQMLKIAEQKIKRAGLADQVKFDRQDCAALREHDNTYDAATIAFGLRNFEFLDKSLSEINRTLKPEGYLLVLEMNEPQSKFLFFFYKLYIKLFVKITSRLLSADTLAYDYLTHSMHAFPNGKKLIAIFEKAGFKIEKYKTFTFGVCSMYLLKKLPKFL